MVWSVLGTAIKNKIISIIAAIVGVLSVAVVLYATVIKRTQGDFGYDLIPLSSYQRAINNPEIYRSMLMNVFLFVPLGMSLVYVLGGTAPKRILLTVLVGFLLSTGVEAIQYLFLLGMAETDDVICNTFGTFVGSLAYPLSLLWRKLIQKIKIGIYNIK